MTVASRLPRATHERIAALEKRADAHDLVIGPMAGQVAEMYGLLTKWRNINWFVVKLLAATGGTLGAIAVLLTILEKALQLVGHH